MPDNLNDGICTITTLVEGDGKLGINSTEPGSQEVVIDAAHTEWEVKKADEDHAYVLRVKGYGFTYCNGMTLTATTSPNCQVWYITYQEVHDAYTIAKGKHDSSGWNAVLDEVGGKGVKVTPIIYFPTFPARYPPTYLYKFGFLD
ncbi:hypothetical protein JVU11DRAFT_6297 [Chiua virens]|nr:hypothetical protein JVU11DRAFT_6297 [Chiua virens]